MVNKITNYDWLFVPLVIIVTLSTCHPIDDGNNDSQALIESLDKPIVSNDSLPHYRYKAIMDSIARFTYADDHNLSNEIQLFSFGYNIYRNKSETLQAQKDPVYFISLSGYRMKPNTAFTDRGGKWLVKHFVRDRTGKNDSGGRIEARNVGVRFVRDHDENNGRGAVLVPVSFSTYKIIKIIFWMLLACFALFILWALLMTPAFIVARIARGEPFTPQNIRGLYFAGFTLIGFYLLPQLIGLITKIATAHLVPPEMNYQLVENLSQGTGFLYGGFIVLFLSRAFQRGYQLQIQNDSIA